jgi:hypothetical protein
MKDHISVINLADGSPSKVIIHLILNFIDNYK